MKLLVHKRQCVQSLLSYIFNRIHHHHQQKENTGTKFNSTVALFSQRNSTQMTSRWYWPFQQKIWRLSFYLARETGSKPHLHKQHGISGKTTSFRKKERKKEGKMNKCQVSLQTFFMYQACSYVQQHQKKKIDQIGIWLRKCMKITWDLEALFMRWL